MRILKSMRTFFLALLLLAVTSQTAHADINKSAENTLNGLITASKTNETKKEFLADRNNIEEIIDPQTGSLTYKETDFSFPGKDGLDLTLSRIYRSSMAETGTKKISVKESYGEKCNVYYFVIVTYYDPPDDDIIGPYSTYAEASAKASFYNSYRDSSAYVDSENVCVPTSNLSVDNYVEPATYLGTKYDLGAGWSFSLPSVQIEKYDGDTYRYFHDGTGTTYQVDFSKGTTHLVNFEGNDVQFNQDTGTYSVDGLTSAYVFISSDKRKSFFSSDGSLIGIKDRFGNEIKFSYVKRTVNGIERNDISRIQDTIGRVISFTYMINADKKDQIQVTATNPTNSTDKTSVTYIKASALVNNKEVPTLWKVVHEIGTDVPPGLPTEYSDFYGYEIRTTGFRYDTKSTSGASITSVLLNEVTTPTLRSTYVYDTVTRNLGNDGLFQTFRVQSRSDNMWNGMKWHEKEYKKATYTYQNDISGYPTINNEEQLPSGYEFGSELTTAEGLKVRSVYNNNNQLLRKEMTASGGEQKVEENLSFDATYIKKPTRSVIKDINAAKQTVRELYIDRTYTDWGGIESETLPLTWNQLTNNSIKNLYTIRYSYEPNYRLISEKRWYQNATKDQLIESYTYDSLGRILTFKNAKKELIAYAYSSDAEGEKVTITQSLEKNRTSKTVKVYGPQAKFAFPTEVRKYYTNDQNQYITTKSTTEYNLLLGLVSKDIDEEGRTTVFTYDKLGRSINIKLPTYVGLDKNRYKVEQVTDHGRAPRSNILSNWIQTSLIVTDELTQVSRTYSAQEAYYNGYGNLAYQGQWDFNKGKYMIQAEYQFDQTTRPIYSIDAEKNSQTIRYDNWGRLAEQEDTYGNVNRVEYDLTANKKVSYFIAKKNVNIGSNYTDELKENVTETYLDHWGRITQVIQYPDWPNKTNPISNTITYDTSGNILLSKDGNGYSTSYEYDSLNRLTKVIDPDGKEALYNYSVLGQLNNIKQSDGTVIWEKTMDFDERNTLISKSESSSVKETFVNNEVGNLINYTDRNGVQNKYQYDGLNRIYNEQSGSTEFLSYYGMVPFGPTKVEEQAGGVFSRSDSYQYEESYSGNITSRTINNAGLLQKASYKYDLVNRLTSISNNDQFTTNYQYDKLRLDKVQTNGSSTASFSNNSDYAKYEYYDDGKLKSITYPKLNDGNLLHTDYTYDKINRLKTVINYKGTMILSKYSYDEYDNNGNLIKFTDNRGTTTYGYDRQNRLTDIQRPDGSRDKYTYDDRGNRLTLESTSTIPTEPVNYAYDSLNRLESVTKGEEKTSFQYNTEDLRIKKQSAGESVIYNYNQAGDVIAEADGANKTTAQYIRDSGRVLVKKEVSNSSSKDYYYLYNGHGDVVQIIDRDGRIVNTYLYDEWGNIVNQKQKIKNPFKYAGEEYDEETGLYYLKSRYYDPTMGRFISKDTFEGTLTNPMTLNGYTYAYNNPIKYIDPTGHVGTLQWGYMLKGILQSLGDSIWELLKTPSSMKDLVGGFASGELSIKDLASSIASSAIGPFEYLAKNTQKVFYGNPSNAEVKEYGRQLGNVLQLVMGSSAAIKIVSKAIPKLAKAIKAFNGDCNCFVAGTKVQTDEGEKPIEEIEVGDKVLAKSDETGEVAYKEVVGLFQKQAAEIFKVHIGDEIIEATAEHPFWLEGKGWTEVKDLKVGDLLVKSDGATLAIDKIEKEPRQANVYNFEVKDFNSYFVSNLGIWVHNCAVKKNPFDLSDVSLSKWNKGSFDDVEGSAIYHFKEHGTEVGAEDLAQYIRKAEDFARTAKKGSTKSPVYGKVEGTTRYKKNGKYVDIAPDGTIVSFGKS